MIDNVQIVCKYFKNLQNKICKKVQDEESFLFLKDDWERPEGGGGQSRILENGLVFEKAGINFSDIYGSKLPPTANLNIKRSLYKDASFRAMGISLVFHPQNPHVPTCHMNLRYFTILKNSKSISSWFGGGYDLTPCYGYEEDNIHWHKTAKKACDPYGNNIYEKYKKDCDSYFYLPHRKEPRELVGYFLMI